MKDQELIDLLKQQAKEIADANIAGYGNTMLDAASRLEQLVMPTAGSKPPLGVIPHIIWLEKRITELSRALYEYFTNGYYDDNTYKWLMELYNVYRQRDRYIEEQQSGKGCSA